MNERFPAGSGEIRHESVIASAIGQTRLWHGLAAVPALQRQERRRKMVKFIRNIALSALIGLGALSVLPATASADSLVIRAGTTNGGIAIQIRDRGHDRWDRRDRWRGHHHRHGPRMRACSPRQAVNKAGRIGIRHARVHHASHRTIAVGGRSHGRHVRVLFARVPGCPIIG